MGPLLGRWASAATAHHACAQSAVPRTCMQVVWRTERLPPAALLVTLVPPLLMLRHILPAPHARRGHTARLSSAASGIFAVDGEEWRWQRKLAARIFSVSRCAEA
jgi:hypothetical protein